MDARVVARPGGGHPARGARATPGGHDAFAVFDPDVDRRPGRRRRRRCRVRPRRDPVGGTEGETRGSPRRLIGGPCRVTWTRRCTSRICRIAPRRGRWLSFSDSAARFSTFDWAATIRANLSRVLPRRVQDDRGGGEGAGTQRFQLFRTRHPRADGQDGGTTQRRTRRTAREGTRESTPARRRRGVGFVSPTRRTSTSSCPSRANRSCPWIMEDSWRITVRWYRWNTCRRSRRSRRRRRRRCGGTWLLRGDACGGRGVARRRSGRMARPSRGRWWCSNAISRYVPRVATTVT